MVPFQPVKFRSVTFRQVLFLEYPALSLSLSQPRDSCWLSNIYIL